MTETNDRVAQIIVEHLACDADKVTPEAHLEDDLGGDSLDRVELVMAFEEEFRIEITDDESDKIYTVKDCIDVVSSKLQSEAA